MSTNETTTTTTGAAAAEILQQPAPTLSPEAVIEHLRALRAQIGEVAPLTVAQRRSMKRRAHTAAPVLQASINVIGASDTISSAVGQPVDNVRRLHEESNRWTAVEDELKAMLSGVAGANLVRRHRIALVTKQAVGIGVQLARDPANAALVPHMEEVRRLRVVRRRKKATVPPTQEVK